MIPALWHCQPEPAQAQLQHAEQPTASPMVSRNCLAQGCLSYGLGGSLSMSSRADLFLISIHDSELIIDHSVPIRPDVGRCHSELQGIEGPRELHQQVCLVRP